MYKYLYPDIWMTKVENSKIYIMCIVYIYCTQTMMTKVLRRLYSTYEGGYNSIVMVFLNPLKRILGPLCHHH